jgi:transcriptional regulator with XRE-family HTH domain
MHKKEGTELCTLYERIANLCKEKGVSGSRMCLELGLSKSTLSNMKNGRTTGLSATTAQKIASYLGVSVGYLLGEEEKEEKPTVNDDELSDNMQKLMKWALSVPENKQELAIKLLQTIVEDEQ